MERSEISRRIEGLLREAEGRAEVDYGPLLDIAQQRLLRLTRKMMQGYSRLKRWEETDDVFQLSAMRLHRSLSDVKPTTSRQFFGLAATQIRRTLLDLCRHHFGPAGGAGNHETDFFVSDSVHQPLIERQASPSADQDEGHLENWSAFHEAVERLPHEECEVFSMNWYFGLTHGEIADTLGVSERTVIRRNNRARLKLRSVWQD